MVARCWKKQGCGGHRKDLVIAGGNGEIWDRVGGGEVEWRHLCGDLGLVGLI
jgi:hypothetical protein